MMFGAKLTLIVLTGQRLARIDLAGPRQALRVTQTFSCPAIQSHELAASVAIAYRLGQPPNWSSAQPSWRSRFSPGHRSLIVLSDDVWNDSISLPLDVTVLLSPNELQAALKIEAENYSGIAAFQSRIACRQILDISSNLLDASTILPSSNKWWLAQISQIDLDAMATGARACGARFLGATHLQAYMQTLSSAKPESLDIGESDTLRQLGEQWAQALSRDGLTCLVQPELPASNPRNMQWLQTAAALATVLTCGGLYQLRTNQLAAITVQIKALQQTLSDHEAAAAQLRSAISTQQGPPTSRATSEPTKPILVTRPAPTVEPTDQRWLSLFDSLSQVTPEECWIESWQQRDRQTILCGRALSAQIIHNMATRLEHALGNTGWRVGPPQIQEDAQNLMQFELPITFMAQFSDGDWQ